MQTQEEKKTEEVKKYDFRKMAPESAKSDFPTIMIEENLGHRNNEDYHSYRFRWVTKKSGRASGIIGLALGSSPEQRHAIQSFHVDIAKELGLEAGANLNELLKAAGEEPARIAISEITESEFQNLEEEDQIGYSAKINPSTGEYLGHQGERIFRKVFLADLHTGDDYVTSDNIPLKEITEAEDDLPA